MSLSIHGLHHVTAIASDPQRNLDFYVGLLGLRLVKRTVNFDDPGTYHFYFGDARGTPGTILTFFPWPDARPGIRGAGEIDAIAFAIGPESAGYWLERLKAHGVGAERGPRRFGEEMIRFSDPDGLSIELIAAPLEAGTEPWPGSTVPVEHSIRGFRGASAALGNCERTANLLTEVFGYRAVEEADGRFRFAAPGEAGPGKTLDLIRMPDRAPGRAGAGSVHHIAFRTPDDERQRACREFLVKSGYHLSPVMDRSYFHSIYFREPGGVLFEIATDPPGFTTDELPEELGLNLRLPPRLERMRPQIEAMLPPVTLPEGTTG
ncbi:MAG: ring-cleaving dioxygenase [Verrucomicrobia bacterium]|nr:ring-cleaving dioxygenase [Verrucomicrobiota bacterium]